MSGKRRGRRWWLLGGLFAAPLLALLLLPALHGALLTYPLHPPREPAPEVALGAFHVHSTASDGWGSLEAIAQAARNAGLSFVVMTDHNVPPRPPRWLEGVLILSGAEVSTTSGHLVVLGPRAPEKGLTGADAVASAVADGAFTVLAHPVQGKNPWRDWRAAEQVDAFELYSADTLFRDAIASPVSRLLPAIGGWLGDGVHGTLMLVTPQPAPTAKFLELAARRPLVALCSHDAHGYPPYEDVFRALALQIPGPLEADPTRAAAQVTGALRSGEALCVFQGLGSASDFAIEALAPGRIAWVGDTLEVRFPLLEREDVRLEVTGAGARVGRDRVRLTSEGVVQIEVWARAPGLFGDAWRPWIVPSPVRVLPRL